MTNSSVYICNSFSRKLQVIVVVIALCWLAAYSAMPGFPLATATITMFVSLLAVIQRYSFRRHLQNENQAINNLPNSAERRMIESRLDMLTSTRDSYSAYRLSTQSTVDISVVYDAVYGRVYTVEIQLQVFGSASENGNIHQLRRYYYSIAPNRTIIRRASQHRILSPSHQVPFGNLQLQTDETLRWLHRHDISRLHWALSDTFGSQRNS